MKDDNWWLNLYVMFSRATRMDDMFLLRPPPRDLLERGPPPSMSKRLAQFDRHIEETSFEAIKTAERLGFKLDPIVQ